MTTPTEKTISANTAEEILKLENVSCAYHTESGETLAVDDLSFSAKKGEFISIIGPSGCGKTTVLTMIAGLIKPSGGKITIGGNSASGKSIGYMLQKDQLFPWRTVLKNVYLPLEVKKITTKENFDYGKDLLIKYGLKDFMNSYPDELSGGMRQRAALIRTLVFRPALLLLDEPFSALDYQTRLSVSEDVYKIIRSENQTAVLVTHDISEAISLSDRIIVLTKRPCRVKTVHKINFGNTPPLKRRESPEFSKWFEILFKELQTDD